MRRKYIVDRKYQIPLISWIVILVLAATCVSAGVTLVIMDRLMFHPDQRSTWDLRVLLPVIGGTSLVTLTFVSTISAFIVLRESHRVLGPLPRLKGALSDLAKGRISFVGSLRRDDVLKGFDDDINTLSENLARLDSLLREALDRFKMEIAGLRESESLSLEQVSRIRKCAGDFEEALGFFRSD